MKKSFKIAAGVFVAAGITVNLVFGGYMISRILKLDNKLDSTVDYVKYTKEMIGENAGEKETKEDDVKIAENYTIKSTKKMTDAYKNGNTDNLTDTEKKTLDRANKVLDEIIKDGMTDYEKEEAVYLWMIENIKHDGELLVAIPSANRDVDTPAGVLASKQAVCVGYATTFRMFMEMLDIECKVVHNSEAYHSWDIVKLDDNWYHVDPYSDATSGKYANFNLDDTMMANAQEWDKEYFPAATSLEYNYAFMNSKELEDVFKLPKMLKKAVDSEETQVAVHIKGEENMMLVSYIIDQLASYLGDTAYAYTRVASINEDEKEYLVAVNIEKYNGTSENPNLSEDDYIKVQSALEEAFGQPMYNYDEKEMNDSGINDINISDVITEEIQK